MTELMGSTAQKATYEFFNSAEREGEVGLHLSVHKHETGEVVNLFFDHSTALRMRDALNEIVPFITKEVHDRRVEADRLYYESEEARRSPPSRSES